MVPADYNGLRAALSSERLRRARPEIANTGRSGTVWDKLYFNLKAFVKDSCDRTAALQSQVDKLTTMLRSAQASSQRSEQMLGWAYGDIMETAAWRREHLGMAENDWDVDMGKADLPRTWPQLPPHGKELKTKLVKKFNSLKSRRSQHRKDKNRMAEAAVDKEIAQQLARIWAVHRRFK